SIDSTIEIEVLFYSQIFIEAELLRHITDASLDLRRMAAYIQTKYAPRSPARREQPAESFYYSRLSRTIRSKQTKDLASPNRETDLIDSRELAKFYCQILGNYCLFHPLPPNYLFTSKPSFSFCLCAFVVLFSSFFTTPLPI